VEELVLLRPLGEDSMHHASIHRTWPVGMVRRFYEMSSFTAGAEMAKSIMMSRFRRFSASDSLIESMEAVCSAHRSIRITKNSSCIWVVLPYHPVWVKALTDAVAKFNGLELGHILHNHALGEEALPIRISWSNHYKPFFVNLTMAT